MKKLVILLTLLILGCGAWRLLRPIPDDPVRDEIIQWGGFVDEEDSGPYTLYGWDVVSWPDPPIKVLIGEKAQLDEILACLPRLRRLDGSN